MNLRLHFQRTGKVPGAVEPAAMRDGTLTIGRGAQNDVVLPDADKDVSRRHCAIEDRDGVPTLLDYSVNGTFVNGAKLPVGDRPAVLHQGDVIHVGPYELQVDLEPGDQTGWPEDTAPAEQTTGADAAEPDLAAAHDGSGDFLDRMLGETGSCGDGLVPDDAEQDLMARFKKMSGQSGTPGAKPALRRGTPLSDHVGGASRPQPAAPTPTADAPARRDGAAEDDGSDAVARQTPVPPPAPPDPRPVAASKGFAGGAAPDAALEAFVRALGDDRVDPKEMAKTDAMARFGAITRLAVQGLCRILAARWTIQDKFGVTRQTEFSSRGNNPFKFTGSVDQAIEALARGRDPGLQDGVDAAKEAFEDIQDHEVAMVSGVQAAMRALLSRFDPDAIMTEVDTYRGRGPRLTSNKSVGWDLFTKRFADLQDEAKDDFSGILRDSFAQAYEAQIKQLKAQRREKAKSEARDR